MNAFWLPSRCGLHSHKFVILPSYFFTVGFPVAGAKLLISVQASPWSSVWGSRWRSCGKSWAGCVATGGRQSLHRHPRTWTAQCKKARIARGYAWTSGSMILWRWKFLEDFDFWHLEMGFTIRSEFTELVQHTKQQRSRSVSLKERCGASWAGNRWSFPQVEWKILGGTGSIL